MELPYRNIFITGGCGFVGSNLAVFFKLKYPKVKIIVLDNLSRRGSELNVIRLKKKDIEFIQGDIRNSEDLELKEKIDLIIECSAEPSVLSGYGESPRHVLDNNLIGSINCFELARKDRADIVFLSTSRVYPYEKINNLKVVEEDTRFKWQKEQDGKVKGWSEEGVDVNFSLNGARSMYGATKLCSEIILKEYINMYGLKGVINRCGVIAGSWQFGKVDQGVFALWMLAHFFKKPLKYIGFGGCGKQVRDLLHIDDLFDLIDLQINIMDKVNNQVFNVGGGNLVSLSLQETTKLCEKISGNKIEISQEQITRPADLGIYITDNRKVRDLLSWKPKRNPSKILQDIYDWIRENEKQLSEL
ncbi:MAG: NAD-dependent epimerase/dehydratase family protein [Candidatus Omnitrophica bacterium]|nr:NAD-dependent epimerase/dehydratase family protein [Candidatus Omnitrophota bacterium]